MIWEIAGIVGVNPEALTLRELLWMVNAKRREAWTHTSSVLATLANIHRDPKKKPRAFTSNDFNPMLQPSDSKPIKADIQILKRVFVDRTF